MCNEWIGGGVRMPCRLASCVHAVRVEWVLRVPCVDAGFRRVFFLLRSGRDLLRRLWQLRRSRHTAPILLAAPYSLTAEALPAGRILPFIPVAWCRGESEERLQLVFSLPVHHRVFSARVLSSVVTQRRSGAAFVGRRSASRSDTLRCDAPPCW